MKKRIKVFLMMLVMFTCLSGLSQTARAAEGKTSIAVSSSTLNIGDTVTVTVKAVTSGGGKASAEMTLSYHAGILEFVSCSASSYDSGDGSVTASADSFSVTLKAIAAGTSGLMLSAVDGADFNTNEELESMEGSSTNITVNSNAANNGGSSNEGGNNGTGSVGSTGEAPAPPQPQAPSVPQAPEAAGEEIIVNNNSYRIAASIPEEMIPADFTVMAVNYHGNSCQGLGFDKGNITLFYLLDENDGNAGNLFIYDETRETIYDFAKMSCGRSYVIPLPAPADYELPETYTQASFFTADGRTVQAFQVLAEDDTASEFYLFYGVNGDGAEGWYQYDSLEGTYQRRSNLSAGADQEDLMDSYSYLQGEYYELSGKYKKEKSSSRNIIACLSFAIAVLIIIMINILVFGWKKLHAEPEGYEEEDEYEDEESGEYLDSEEDEEDILQESSRDEEPAVKKEMPGGKGTAGNKETEDIDVIDLNDL